MSPLILYTTAALMAIVGFFCTWLCVCWSIPSWRMRLAVSPSIPQVLGIQQTHSLTGWPVRVGSVLISAGIAACALTCGYGCCCVLVAV